LKAALVEGRATAERLLIKDRHGRRCAERLCFMLDEIIRVLFEFAVRHLYPSQNPSEAERMAIIATGGYGRGVLAPGSDIDLLFLLPYKQTAWGESVAEALLYCLWDMGLKVGHATRTVNECIRQAKADMTIRTNLLEARYLCGDQELYQDLRRRYAKEVVAGTARAFVEAKLAERDERHRRMGNSRYALEPNIKEGKGGLRDLQTLRWIGRFLYNAETTDKLVEEGVLTRDAAHRFDKAEAYLWLLRCHLHFLRERGEDKLTFDIQLEIARRLGYRDHAGNNAVERLMKHYFLTAKSVGELTRFFCTAVEAQHVKRSFIRLPSIGLRKRELEG
ncbi:MAG: nucleotidyltransferase domain-containing protein, partial [Burkholderiales bacterium]